MRNKYSCKSEFVWNVHIKVMLKVISISILDQHAWACWDMVARGTVFLNSQTGSQMYTFPDQMNWQFVQILMESKFQSKLRVLDTHDVKQKTSLFSVQGKSAWCVFMVCSNSFDLYVTAWSSLVSFVSVDSRTVPSRHRFRLQCNCTILSLPLDTFVVAVLPSLC